MKKVEIFTDGSCLGNPGTGGIGILLRYQLHEKTVSKGYFQTTNNRMELRAVIEALSMLKEPTMFVFFGDHIPSLGADCDNLIVPHAGPH